MSRTNLGDVVDVNGRALRVKIDHSDPDQETAPTLVLINGMGCSLDYWDPVVQRLAEFTCVRYDRPGLGGSPSAAPASDSIDCEVALLITLCEVTVAANQPVVLVAHSYGGLIAETAIRLHPKRFAGLVLVDGTDPLDHVNDGTRAESLVALAVSIAVEVPGVAKVLGTTAERAVTFTSTIAAGGPRLSRQQRALVASRSHIRNTFAEDLRIPGQCQEVIDIAERHPFPAVPVLLVVASDQRTLTRTRRANEWIRQNEVRVDSFGPQASVQILRSAHLMMFDVPEAVATAISDLAAGVQR